MAARPSPPLKGLMPGPAQPFYFTDLIRRLSMRIMNQVESDRVNKAPRFRLTLKGLAECCGMKYDTIFRLLTEARAINPDTMDRLMHALAINVYDLLDATKLESKGIVKAAGTYKTLQVCSKTDSLIRSINTILKVAGEYEYNDPKALELRNVAAELSQQFSYVKPLKLPALAKLEPRVFAKPAKAPFRARPWLHVPAVVLHYMQEFAVTKEYVRSFVVHELEVWRNSAGDPMRQPSEQSHIRFKMGCNMVEADRVIRWATMRLLPGRTKGTENVPDSEISPD